MKSDDPNNQTSDQDPTIVPLGSNPSIRVIKTARVIEDGNGDLGVDDIIEFTIEVENDGDVVLSDID